MILLGSEVKSLKAHQGSLQDAYVLVFKGEVVLKNSLIAHYAQAAMFSHEERRDRKLLLHKREIGTLIKSTQVKGLTIIPLSIYLKRGFVKIQIGVAKGKKAYDKRQDLKRKEAKRAIEREMKGR